MALADPAPSVPVAGRVAARGHILRRHGAVLGGAGSPAPCDGVVMRFALGCYMMLWNLGPGGAG